MASTMTPTPAAVERLPKWARQELERLQRELEHTEKRLAAALAAQELAAEDYAVVPTGERSVRFHLTDERYPFIEVRRHESRRGQPTLAVSCSEGLLVRPQASNVVLVQAEGL